jgi:hypothetical protein
MYSTYSYFFASRCTGTTVKNYYSLPKQSCTQIIVNSLLLRAGLFRLFVFLLYYTCTVLAYLSFHISGGRGLSEMSRTVQFRNSFKPRMDKSRTSNYPSILGCRLQVELSINAILDCRLQVKGFLLVASSTSTNTVRFHPPSVRAVGPTSPVCSYWPTFIVSLPVLIQRTSVAVSVGKRAS